MSALEIWFLIIGIIGVCGLTYLKATNSTARRTVYSFTRRGEVLVRLIGKTGEQKTIVRGQVTETGPDGSFRLCHWPFTPLTQSEKTLPLKVGELLEVEIPAMPGLGDPCRYTTFHKVRGGKSNDFLGVSTFAIFLGITRNKS